MTEAAKAGIKIQVVAFEEGSDARHVVEVDQDGVKRRVTVRVSEVAWQGLGWFAVAEPRVRDVVERYVTLHAADGTLQDEAFISDDEAKDIHWGNK